MNWDRVERLLGKDVLAYLQTRTVGIIGLGSGGSFVAVALAMSGIGKFILIDSDMLEPANVVRHAADQRYVGKPKVEAVADLIKQRNPDAEVKTVVGRIEDHLDLLPQMDVVVAGVDKEALTKLADTFRTKFPANGVCVIASTGESVTVMAAVTQDLIKRGLKAGDLVSHISRQLGAGGGGAPHLAFGGGKEVSKLPEALASVKGWLVEKVK